METLYRRWLIIQMIPRHGNSITTTEIVRRLEAESLEAKSIRTIQRDLEELSGIFPIYNEQEGRTFYWSWEKNAALCNIPVMAPQTALTFCLVDDYLAALLPKSTLNNLDPYFSLARGVMAANPELALSRWRDKVRIVSRNLKMQPPSFAAGITDAIYEALLKSRRITLRYRPRYETKTKTYTEINPLGLVFVDSIIYLVASLNNEPDELRQFLLHRMESVKVLDLPVEVPDGFTLQEYVDSGELGYPEADEAIRLKALFDRDAAAYLYETPLPGTISLTDADEDVVLLEAEVQDSLQLRWWLRGFGSQVEVLEPAELREEFQKLSMDLAKLYC